MHLLIINAAHSIPHAGNPGEAVHISVQLVHNPINRFSAQIVTR